MRGGGGWHRHITWTKAKKRILNKRSECYAKNKTNKKKRVKSSQ
jgi:hypothetical protein